MIHDGDLTVPMWRFVVASSSSKGERAMPGMGSPWWNECMGLCMMRIDLASWVIGRQCTTMMCGKPKVSVGSFWSADDGR